jgi:hypothetical protein
LHKSIEDVAIGIDGAPQPVFLPLDRHDHLIEVPLVGKVTARAPPQLMGKFTTELRRPLRDGLKRDVNAALGQQVFDVTQAQRNLIIEPWASIARNGAASPVISRAGDVNCSAHAGMKLAKMREFSRSRQLEAPGRTLR